MTPEELAGLGRIKAEIEVFKGLKVVFHSLSVKEEEEVNVAVSQCPQDLMARSAALQIETLCRAIESIGGKTFIDVKDLRKYIESLQRHVLSALWISWTSDFDSKSLKEIDDLKKNSEERVPV